MYHDVVRAGNEDGSGFPGRDAALYKVTPERFEEHLRALGDVRRAKGAPLLTFDDGGVSAMAAADALERHGLRGHFFVTTNYVGTRGFLESSHIRELHARGHVVGSHSCSHPLRMGHCSRAQLGDEWARSCGVLGAILGEPVTIASVPGGDFAPAVADAAARAGIQRLFTSEPTSAVRLLHGLVLYGRFTIQRWTRPETVRDLAGGAWLPRARQTAVWNTKKVSKRMAGELYLTIRRLLLRHGNEVRWGDL